MEDFTASFQKDELSHAAKVSGFNNVEKDAVRREVAIVVASVARALAEAGCHVMAGAVVNRASRPEQNGG